MRPIWLWFAARQFPHKDRPDNENRREVNARRPESHHQPEAFQAAMVGESEEKPETA
jgi:hypothetical protein